MDLISRLRTLVEEELRDTEYFVVDVLGGDKSKKISVLLDGDNGITVEKCSYISRQVSKVIDEDAFEADAFILEVSSPGADKPLIKPRQYAKHVGRDLNISMINGEELSGTLQEVMDDSIRVSPSGSKKGKKPHPKSGQKANKLDSTNLVDVPFSNIGESTVVISFKK